MYDAEGDHGRSAGDRLGTIGTNDNDDDSSGVLDMGICS